MKFNLIDRIKYWNGGIIRTKWLRIDFVATWYLGYHIERTMVLNPRKLIVLCIIPGIAIRIGIAK